MAKPRIENATVPAPESGTGRPTSVPEFDMAAIAGGALPDAKVAPLPLDLCVPVRRRASSADGTPFRAAFLLSHVDDHSTIGEIALAAQLPVADAIEAFQLLADLGLVEIRGTTPRQTATRGEPTKTKSGLRSRT